MGKKTTATSAKSTVPESEPVASRKPRRATGKEPAKKPPLAKKAAQALAAVALGVGTAITAKRTKRKASSQTSKLPVDSAKSTDNQHSWHPTHEEIAVRAYFISEARREAGLPSDPHQDWIRAETELMRTPNQPST